MNPVWVQCFWIEDVQIERSSQRGDDGPAAVLHLHPTALAHPRWMETRPFDGLHPPRLLDLAPIEEVEGLNLLHGKQGHACV